MPWRVALLMIGIVLGPLLGAAMLRNPARHPLMRTLPLTSHASYSATIMDEARHRAYILNRFDDSLSLLDTRAGTVLRTMALSPQSPGIFATGIVLDGANGRLFISSDDGAIHMLDAGTLRLLNTAHLAEWTGSSLMALAPRAGGLFVVGTIPGAHVVSLFAARSGMLLRRLSGPYAYKGAALDRRGRLFSIGYGSADVFVLDRTSAAPRLFRTIAGVPAGGFDSIATDPLSDLLYLAGLYGDRVYVIEAGAGASRSPIVVSGAVTAVIPTGVRDRALIADDAGMLSLADARRGRVLHAVRIGMGATLPYALDADHDHLFAWDVSGTVEEIDLQMGRVLRTVRVGRTRPAQLVLNPVTGHVLLLYRGSDSRAGHLGVGGSMRVVSLRGDPIGPNIPLGPVPELFGIDDRSALAFVANARGDPQPSEGVPGTAASGWIRLLRRWLPFVPLALDRVPAGGTVSVLDAARL